MFYICLFFVKGNARLYHEYPNRTLPDSVPHIPGAQERKTGKLCSVVNHYTNQIFKEIVSYN